MPVRLPSADNERYIDEGADMAPPGTVAASTAALLHWAGEGGLSVASGPPGPQRSADVHVWLLALLPEQQVHPGNGAGQLRLRMRYLLSTGRPDDLATLDRLLLASIGTAYRPVFDDIPLRLWETAGVAPRPAFYLDVVGHLERPASAAPRVHVPLRVDLQLHRHTELRKD